MYHDGRKISGADIDTFLPLSDTYSKDGNHVYMENRVLEDADPGTFVIVADQSRKKSEIYTKDDRHVYY